MSEKNNIREQITRQNTELDGLEALIREQMIASISGGSDLQDTLDTKLAMISAMRAGLAAGIPLSSQAIQASMAEITTNATAHQAKDQKGINIAAALGEIAARESDLAREAEDFRNYEAQSYAAIQASAAAQGIDITDIEAERDKLIKDRDAAIAAGDTLGGYKADVGLAQTNIDGLDAVGASDTDKQAAQDQRDQAYARYLEQVELEAQRKANEIGLSGDHAQNYITASVITAKEELDTQQERIAQQAVIHDSPQLDDKTSIHVDMASKQAGIEQEKANVQIASGDFAPLVEGIPAKGFDFDEADLMDDKAPNSGLPVEQQGPRERV